MVNAAEVNEYLNDYFFSHQQYITNTNNVPRELIRDKKDATRNISEINRDVLLYLIQNTKKPFSIITGFSGGSIKNL